MVLCAAGKVAKVVKLIVMHYSLGLTIVSWDVWWGYEVL
jgi:hypothetical protein